MASRIVLDSPDVYVVAWIAALFIERAAAEAMLDEEHAAPASFTRHRTDTNVYTWGRIGEHNIVIASLPAGVYGTTSAATTASNLLASLPSIRIGLLVGIGGGIARPDEDHDIRLGDVVVSQPDGTTGGVCQYDLIKAKAGDRRERQGFLGRPPTVLLNALASIQAEHERKDSKIPHLLQAMLEKNPKMGKRFKKNPGYTNQGFENDHLFRVASSHVPGPDCRGCDTADEVQRDPRDTTDPYIHYGIIASGNTLVKDAAARDRLFAHVGEDCICFEMEAAGLMNHFPCLVIRGICDYADSHQNDRWQCYASATAAAYAKELLGYVPGAEVLETRRALEVLQSGWLRPPDPSTNANYARALRLEGTDTWLLEAPAFQSWLSGSRRNVWLRGLAGCGKTVLSAAVLDHLGKVSGGLVFSFFFNFDNRTKQTVDGMLRSLTFQLYQAGLGLADLLDASFQAHQDGKHQPTTKALEDVVFKMLAVSNKCFIVLDALDESTTQREVLLWMENVVSRQELGNVQLICTGRPESEFLRGIPRLFGQENCFALDKQAVNADIRSWVTVQLSQRADFQNKSLSEDVVERITKMVGDGADGMLDTAAFD
ncbi:Pfs, NACHT and Ankyrin domain protein [Cordyceps fumosorosea ARSEF 2679]|uniref:Pfs, NACHT and Ankyrin domain protein n=1 Tax=Cordyceps fumosorosea (strain ARSEF 2679) TaxID=1081104 RepID=A0A162LN55_CORFA|nr:Pfs, NACHT and Ankyrin domain protein [Cordyceps fumosorosea ARSEF 2679]OAA73114.1 Pfs, NACHT and Ankyrin domain protein [Cordyceps fumosorosea ARSEF 2679]